MPKFFLIDGSSFIFRAFYGIPPMFRSDGTPVNAVFGFCSMILRLIAKRKHGRYAVIADSGRKTFRNDIFADYKANRAETPEELKPQFALIQEAIEAFSLPSISMIGFEADDIIATYSREAHEKGHEVEIISSDKDLMQLVNHTVYMYDAMKDKEIRAPEVLEKFGIRPDQVVDLQAMMGDSSDNVPGVKGVGPKTAAKLLQEFETLEGVYENIDKIPQAGLRKKLTENKEMAFLSRQLVQLEENIPELPNLEDIVEANIDIEKLRKFFDKMEFRQLAPRLDNLNGGTKKVNDYAGVKKINTSIEADIFLQKLQEEKQISIALSEKGLCVYTPTTSAGCFRFQTEMTDLFSSQPAFFDKLIPILKDEKIEKIGFDVKKILHTLKGDLTNYTDVQTLGYDCLGEPNLNALGRHFHFSPAPLFQEFSDKAGYEAHTIWYLNEELKKLIESDSDRQKLYNEIDKPLVSVLFKMEKNGITIDQTRLGKIEKHVSVEIKKLEEKIRIDIPEEVNLDSPKQLGIFLFEDFGVKYKGRKTSSGQYSTDNKHLQKVSEGNPIIELILKRREFVKLRSTYIEGLAKTIKSD
ncbi:MAG: DNA polymerase, partial [Alphaproteobacteria bacterium]